MNVHHSRNTHISNEKHFIIVLSLNVLSCFLEVVLFLQCFVIVFMWSDRRIFLNDKMKPEDRSHPSNNTQTHYTLYLMETLVTIKGLETAKEIVCKISKICKQFQADFTLAVFLKVAEMKSVCASAPVPVCVSMCNV